MAEFTRDIQQLTKTASAVPQVATPSQSLGTDIVNAVGTGLQFFAKQKATEELGKLKQRQQAYETRIAQGVLGLRNQRQSLVNQEGVTRTMLLEKDTEFLSQFSPQERVEILRETKKITGQTLSSVSATLATQEDELEAAAAKKLTERQTLEEEVVALRPYLTEVPNLGESEEQLRMWKLQGMAAKAAEEKRAADQTLRNAQLSGKKSQNELNAQLFFSEYGNKAGNMYIQSSKELLKEIDFNNSSEVAEGIHNINNAKTLFVENAVKQAAEAGVPITPKQAEEQLAPQLEVFDNIAKYMRRDDIATLSSNQKTFAINNMYMSIVNSEDPRKRKLAEMLLMGETFEGSPYLQSEISKGYIDTLLRGMGGLPAPGDDVQQAGVTERAVGFVKNIFKSAQDVNEIAKEEFTETILNDLAGSKSKREKLFQNGGFVGYIEAIAQGKPENVLDPNKQDEVFEHIMNNSEAFLRRTIPAMLNAQQPSSITPSGRGIKQRKGPAVESGTGEEVFSPLDENLKVSVKDNKLLSVHARNYNKWVDNVFTAMEKLGGNEDEIKEFKDRIRNSFLKAKTDNF